MVDKIEDLEVSEPYVRLATMRAAVWNRWVRTSFSDEEVKHYAARHNDLLGMREGYDLVSNPFVDVTPLTPNEAAELARSLNLDRLPGYDRPPTFDKVDFTKQTLREIDFSYFIFANSIDAPRTGDDDEEMEAVTFKSAKFRDGIWFVGATFGSFADFSGATFGENAKFDDTTFLENAFFNQAKFNSYADFSGALFLRGADFRGASFGDFSHFDGAIFQDGFKADRANFGRYASFSGASFGDDTAFVGAKFGEKASFDGWNLEEINKWARYRPGCGTPEGGEIISRAANRVSNGQPRAMSRISFRRSHFRGFSSFKNREFTGDADFSSAIFEDVPDFATSSGFNHLDLSELRISFGGRLQFPGPRQIGATNRRRYSLNWTTDSAVEARIRRLRKIAKDIEAGDLERELLILERKAQRGIQFRGVLPPTDNSGEPIFHDGMPVGHTYRGPKFFRRHSERVRYGLKILLLALRPSVLRPIGLTLTLAVYWATSNYGRSLLRPMLCFAVAIPLFHAAYWTIYRNDNRANVPFFDRDLCSFTLENSLPWLGGFTQARADLLRRLFLEPTLRGIRIPMAIELVSVVQAATVAALLFLFLLALRNRFRLN